MQPESTTRETILDAFRDLVVEDGERAATIAATAARAGVSKGGLFYHFPSRDALADALILRLAAVNARHCERIRTAAEGPIAYFLRDAIALGTPLDLALTSVTRLDQSGRHPEARPALEAVVNQWRDTLTEALGDPVVARIVQVLGDGLFFNSSLAGSSDAVVASRVTPDELERMITTIESLSTHTPSAHTPSAH